MQLPHAQQQGGFIHQGHYPQHPYVQSYPPGPSPGQQTGDPYSNPPRPQNLVLDGLEGHMTSPIDLYQPSPTAVPTPQSPAYMYNHRKPPPRYPYITQQGSPVQSPHGHYVIYPGFPATTPTGFPAPGSAQGVGTPSMQGPPPYVTPNTPTDSGCYGSVPNVHAVPSPFSRAVRLYRASVCC